MALSDIAVAVEYSQADGSVYRRTGSCCRCGECCASGDPFQQDAGEPKPCRLLQGPDEAGQYSCGDRTNPYYVNSCAVWPSAPEHVAGFSSCSYVFERVS